MLQRASKHSELLKAIMAFLTIWTKSSAVQWEQHYKTDRNREALNEDEKLSRSKCWWHLLSTGIYSIWISTSSAFKFTRKQKDSYFKCFIKLYSNRNKRIYFGKENLLPWIRIVKLNQKYHKTICFLVKFFTRMVIQTDSS